MASADKKAERKAHALNELDRLSRQITSQLGIEVPQLRTRNNDPEMQGIQRIEAVNQLLSRVMEAVSTESKSELDGMTKAELLQKAAEEGVEVPKTAKKAEIIEAVKSTK